MSKSLAGVVRMTWICSLAAAVFFLANAAASAQGMGTGGGGGGAGGGGGGGGLGSGGLGSGGLGAGSGGAGSTLAPSSSLGPTVAIGGTGTRGPSAGAGGTTIPTSSNIFRTYYNNLYQAGLSTQSNTTGTNFSSASAGGFGQPLYAITTTTAGGLASLTSTQPGGAGFTTMGMRKAPAYVTTLSDDFVLPKHSPEQLRKDLQAVLQRSSALKGQGNIQLVVNESGVILRGQVTGARERRLAESLIRLTPGVYDVQNELLTSATEKSTGE